MRPAPARDCAGDDGRVIARTLCERREPFARSRASAVLRLTLALSHSPLGFKGSGAITEHFAKLGRATAGILGFHASHAARYHQRGPELDEKIQLATLSVR